MSNSMVFFVKMKQKQKITGHAQTNKDMEKNDVDTKQCRKKTFKITIKTLVSNKFLWRDCIG